MTIDHALIDRLAALSMLYFTDNEKDEMMAGLENMLGFINKLNELDTKDVEPLLHVSQHQKILREDLPGNMITRDEAFMNAHQYNESHFLVPVAIKKTSE